MKVLFFSVAREASGCAEAEIPLPEPASIEGVWERLIERHPALVELRDAARLSCNDVYADASTRFLDEDVVAVIPPVSGG
ncbi:MAG TPA: MoaD/ThiS family protein [Chthoniobacterales bacterium]|jgi:molybdopterin converting factor small subunit